MSVSLRSVPVLDLRRRRYSCIHRLSLFQREGSTFLQRINTILRLVHNTQPDRARWKEAATLLLHESYKPTQSPTIGHYSLTPEKMLFEAIQTFFVLPVLLLVSIPLALSASITMLMAFAALFLRAFIIYIELAGALLINFFLFPARSPTTGSFLAFSEVNTPAAGSPSKLRYRHYNPHRPTHDVKTWGDGLSASKEVDYFFSHHSVWASHFPCLNTGF